ERSGDEQRDRGQRGVQRGRSGGEVVDVTEKRHAPQEEVAQRRVEEEEAEERRPGVRVAQDLAGAGQDVAERRRARRVAAGTAGPIPDRGRAEQRAPPS